jgi:hypothetical protein
VLLDVSVSGARIGFPPHEELPLVGSVVTLQDAALLAPFLEKREATVMWALGVQFGVRFLHRIDVDLADMAKLLQSEIFY